MCIDLKLHPVQIKHVALLLIVHEKINKNFICFTLKIIQIEEESKIQ